ncbi:MAG: pyrroline-5-carboxylate reductase [Polaromonas sp.]|nr:pyrroline-5-carboxylate reductase [Polaromonas sp.]
MTSATASTASESSGIIAFIGGGNMASAIIGGLLKQGRPARQIQIVEPWAEQRSKLAADFGITAQAEPDAALAAATLVVWAVKPQTFKQAAQQAGPHTGQALHLSVAAGIRSGSIAGWLGSERIVRAMPNTPALVGKGMTALFARAAVNAADRLAVERVIQPTGEMLWLDKETQLDAVTALSGSGPAYVFYFLEAMVQAGSAMGLSREQAHQLAVQTFVGASALAKASSEPPEILRERVTSKGGTTHAALTALEQSGVKQHFMQAIQAANQRAAELGDEYGSA